jgi:hypothetical protein
MMDELKGELKKFEKSNGQINMTLYNQSEVKKMIDYKYSFCSNNTEKFYCTRNDIYSIPLCFCLNKLIFKNTKIGYGNYCSTKCSNSSNIKKEKTKKSNLKKFDVEHYAQTEEFKLKFKQTCLSRYGEDNPSKIEKFKQKSKMTCLKKYNVMYSFQSENNKIKSKNTMLSRYGVQFSQQSTDIKNKSLTTRSLNISKHDIKFKIQNPNWSNKDYFIKNFFDKYFDYRKCMLYFNCSIFSVYRQLKKLNIKYIKKPAGFKINRPGWLYYLKINYQNEFYFKIGVTNHSIEERFTKAELKNIEVLEYDYFIKGEDAYILEQMVLYQNKIHKTNKKILISGNSEIFNIDIRK